jgi:hypothetical protein
MMRCFITIAFMLVAVPQAVSAYEVVVHDVAKPYDVLLLGGSGIESSVSVVGELDGYPEMVELTSESVFPLSVQLYALPSTTTPDFNGMVIRVLSPRGVEEVSRLKAGSVAWETTIDPVSKLRFLEGPVFVGEVASGTYRIEVSTPQNYGKYLLKIGEADISGGYKDTWRSVSQLYAWAEVSKIGMIRTPLVYIPLGIILLVLGFGYTIWQTRDRLTFLKYHA